MSPFHPSFLIFASWLCTFAVLSEPILPRQGNPQNVWVSVDASGSARTITPSISASKTISGAPEYVTATSVYTITTASGIVETSTGMPPVATATTNSGAGAFVECSNYQGWDAPFCLPKRGSILNPGVTYYVTWDTSYFAVASTPVSVQIRYSDNTGSMTFWNTSAEAGYSSWTVDEDILHRDDRDGSDLAATLYLAYMELLGNGVEYHAGPNVTISKSAPSYDASPKNNLKSHSKTVAVAVPVTLGVILLALGMFLLWSWSRHRSVFGMELRRGRQAPKRTISGSNYGWPEDKSHQVELVDRESWTSTQGENVFREEIRRQEMMREF
ncbi:putative membrane protein P31B10.04 [Cytospora mali]|uniref:Membrane protein P31B10.04 n=1 Tax=Cytospora mali TaxID=578113 RepID=A0A194VIA3_CYTMA|nr:putative membrane protein P31B10.04 [Valsa mali]